jgi:hypothetical protein
MHSSDIIENIDDLGHDLETCWQYEWMLHKEVEINDLIVEAFVAVIRYLSHAVNYLKIVQLRPSNELSKWIYRGIKPRV